MGGLMQLIAYGSLDVYLSDKHQRIDIFDSSSILYKWNYPNDFVPLYIRNKYRIETILDMYDSYVTTLLCIKKIKKDINHPLWLPMELWNHIINYIKKDIDTFEVRNNNYTKSYYDKTNIFNTYTSLHELATYKQELHALKTQDSDTKDDLSKTKFRKKINTRKQKRIDGYKRKIYAY